MQALCLEEGVQQLMSFVTSNAESSRYVVCKSKKNRGRSSRRQARGQAKCEGQVAGDAHAEFQRGITSPATRST
eukprot:751089-Pleurochrysis_carterae.AAC.4